LTESLPDSNDFTIALTQANTGVVNTYSYTIKAVAEGDAEATYSNDMTIVEVPCEPTLVFTEQTYDLFLPSGAELDESLLTGTTEIVTAAYPECKHTFALAASDG
jgi:hypothetical protein